MKLYEMMDKTPLPGALEEEKTYLHYMKKHRPDHYNGLINFLSNSFDKERLSDYMSAINLGADMFGLQVLQHGMPEDITEVYGKASGPLLWRP